MIFKKLPSKGSKWYHTFMEFEFKNAENIELLQLNATGMRIIILFSLLLEAPRTLEEIMTEYEKHPLIKDVSDDTVRNDINALRDAGCEISYATKMNYPYVLLKHPFDIELKKSQINAFKKIYNRFYEDFTFEELFAIDSFFEKIIKYSNNDELNEEIRKISKLSSYNKDLVKSLIHYANSNYKITISYRPRVGVIKQYELIAQKVAFRHNKLYLFCIDTRYMKNAFFKVENILSIINVNIKKAEEKSKPFIAKYKLLNVKEENYALLNNEKVVEVSGDDLIIEASSPNEFIMMQNVLNFGKRCVVLEPLDFREKIVEKIKAIRGVYLNEEK